MNQCIAVDSDKCIGCGTCLLACSEAHRSAGRQTNPRLVKIQTREISATVSCHHCQGAPCALVCPVGAIKTQDGHIIVDEKSCISCKMCALSCPFGAIRLSGTSLAGVAGISYETPSFPKSTSDVIAWSIGVHASAVKCDLCAFKKEGPSCVQGCPTGAILIVGGKTSDEATVAKHKRATESSDVFTSISMTLGGA